MITRLCDSVENVKVRPREKTLFIADLYIKSHASHVTKKLKLFRDQTLVAIG